MTRWKGVKMKRVTFASNMWNEIAQLPDWFENVKHFADGGILIVDSGSTDGTIEYARDQGAIVVVDDIIQRDGYAAARNQLRKLSRENFPDSHWMMYMDADERLDLEKAHIFRWIKDYLLPQYDIIAFPRIDWVDTEKKQAANDIMVNPDWQARMIRVDSAMFFYRRLHEQITNYRGIYANTSTPPINHFHRSAKEKRDVIGKLCAKLHREDTEFGHTYPEHPKEKMYRELYDKEGL